MAFLIDYLRSPAVTFPVMGSAAFTKIQALRESINYISRQVNDRSLTRAEKAQVLFEAIYSVCQTLDLGAAGYWLLRSSNMSNTIGFNIHLATAVADVARAVLRDETQLRLTPDNRSATQVVVERAIEAICRAYTYNIFSGTLHIWARVVNDAVVTFCFGSLVYKGIQMIEPPTASHPMEN